MRKENAGFRTAFLSEEGSKLLNRDYFAYVELDNLACYVAADSLDDEKSRNSAEIVVKTILREFTEHPSISSFSIKRNLKKAHRELLSDKDGMRLRASVSMFVTDYVKFRYASVGNSRALLIRNDRILYESKDQSLTENMVEDEVLPKDKAALHEERNNLYAYLGQRDGQPKIQISRKKKLTNGDILILDTRGVWENCDNAELLDCAKEVSTPLELADNVEDAITVQTDSGHKFMSVVRMGQDIAESSLKSMTEILQETLGKEYSIEFGYTDIYHDCKLMVGKHEYTYEGQLQEAVDEVVEKAEHGNER